MNTSVGPGGESLAERLHKARMELEALEQVMQGESVEIEPRVLQEFRNALDNVRQTTWAVNQWLLLRAQQRDVQSLLSTVTYARILRAIHLNRQMAVELERMEAVSASPVLGDLFEAIETLYTRLAPHFRA